MVKASVIPSERAQRRSRGIAGIPKEGTVRAGGTWRCFLERGSNNNKLIPADEISFIRLFLFDPRTRVDDTLRYEGLSPLSR